LSELEILSQLETLSERRCFGGTQGFYRHVSPDCGPMELSVFVPPQPGPRPVVYWLSGLTCTPENFTAKAGAQRVAAELGLILVAPDTSPRGAGIEGEDDAWDLGTGAGFYVDATEAPWSSRYRMFSYVSRELPELIDDAFPSNGRRGILGHSMGGHGALVIALRHPGSWRSVSALAPICAPTRCPWGDKAFSAYLGADRSRWAAYDACELMRARAYPGKILVDQGTTDAFVAEQLKPELLVQAARDGHQELELRMQSGYDHSYYFVASFIEDHLRHHAAALEAKT
jgi:S-formylglutathione hydrolase